MSNSALVKIDQATRALAEARDLDTILEIRDRAVAYNAYMIAKGANEAANVAKEIQVRAERKAGEFLHDLDLKKNREANLIQNAPKLQAATSVSTLDDFGITKDQSHRWQTIAVIPEEIFERHITEVRANEDELTSGELYRMGRKLKQQEERDATKENIAELELGGDRYRTIVIDPPWPVQKILREERPRQDVFDYPTMSIDEIGRLPISELAAENGCHLYLWVTHKYLPIGLDLLGKWGFNYQCLLTWMKPTGMTPFSWMYNTEHVLFGRLGNLQLAQMGLKLGFNAPTNGHSTKPNAFYERVIKASPEPRLELFARQRRDGFLVWGNEV